MRRIVLACDSDGEELISVASGFLIVFVTWQVNIANILIISTTGVSPAPVHNQDFAYTLARLLTIVVGIGMIRAAGNLILPSAHKEQLIGVISLEASEA